MEEATNDLMAALMHTLRDRSRTLSIYAIDWCIIMYLLLNYGTSNCINPCVFSIYKSLNTSHPLRGLYCCRCYWPCCFFSTFDCVLIQKFWFWLLSLQTQNKLFCVFLYCISCHIPKSFVFEKVESLENGLVVVFWNFWSRHVETCVG